MDAAWQLKKKKKNEETKKLNENDDVEHPSEKHGGSLAIKSYGKEQQMTLHLKERMVEENPAALRLPGGVLGGLHVGQLDEHLVQHIKMVRKKHICQLEQHRVQRPRHNHQHWHDQ